VDWQKPVRDPLPAEIEQARVLLYDLQDHEGDPDELLRILSIYFRNHSLLVSEFALDNRNLRQQLKELRQEIKELRDEMG